MASTGHAIGCAIVALLFWTALGWPVARRLSSRSTALPLAPVVGWAVHGVVALPVFWIVPFTTVGIVAVAALTMAASWFFGRRVDRDESDPTAGRVPPLALALAFLLAIAVAAAVVPKQVGDAVLLAEPIFDHSKVAMIDEMARSGMPPGNPFFADDGGSGRLSYYYLLHFSAAELSRVLHVSGWAADIAMTFFAAFTSLAAMMAIAVGLGNRTAASFWVIALAATSSARVVLIALFGATAVDAWLPNPGGLGGWLFQSSWVPQHLISTSCVLVAVLSMTRLAERGGAFHVVMLAALMAAAFQSSTWVGGIVLALVAVVVVPLLAIRLEPSRRLRFLVAVVVAAALAMLLASPLIVEQFAASALRGSGFPIALRGVPVLGNAVPDGWRWTSKIAYWLVLLPVAMPAIYLAGLWAMTQFARDRAASSFAAVGVVSLLASGLLASTLAVNNDLGWRAALLASTTLIVFAAVGLSSWVAARRWMTVVPAIVALALGVPEGVLQVQRNFTGQSTADGRAFATMPELWAAVRTHASADERVASNPLALARMTPWPVNIGWALLANRRACYASWELNQVFTAVPHDRLAAIDDRFVRAFAGTASPAEIADLAAVHGCDVAVVTPEDGAWTADGFRTSPAFVRVEERAGRWRIYRRR